MNRHTDGSLYSRGTVLVASNSSVFINIVGDMLVDDGFTIAFPAESEAAWLSVTRTQPTLVICDSGVPKASIKRLIGETAVRGLPLLMAWSRATHDDYASGISLPERAAWLTFPVDHVTFRSTVDGLLPQQFGPLQRLTLAGAGVRVEAEIGVRTLEEVRRDETAMAEGRSVATPDRTVRRSIRLLP